MIEEMLNALCIVAVIAFGAGLATALLVDRLFGFRVAEQPEPKPEPEPEPQASELKTFGSKRR